MSNYKIRVRVEIEESKAEEQIKPEKGEKGEFSLVISDKKASSIDDCEEALLKVNYEAMREAISKHLSKVSKKK